MELNYYVVNRETGEKTIYHHGIKGQRWGHRLYQNKDGSLTPLGRIRYRKNPEEGRALVTRTKKELAIRKAREAKAAKKAEEEKRKAQEEAEAKAKAEREAAKQKLINSGTADEVYKHRSQLTKDEIEKAISRINAESRLYDLTSEHKAAVEAGKQQAQQAVNKEAEKKVSALDRFENIATAINRVDKATNNVIGAWNTVAKINNTFNDKKMVTINGKKEEKKEKK